MSAERGEKLSVLAVHNLAILTEERAKRAHERIDELKRDTASSFKDIADGLKTISAGLQDIRDWKNRALGWAGAAVFLASILGASIATVITKAVITPNAHAETVGPQRK